MSCSRSNDGGTAEQQAFLKHLKEMGIQDSAASTTCNEFATVVPAAGSDASTDGLGSQGCSVGCSSNTLTKDLLQHLVSEVAQMRCTLDSSLARDKALLAEVQLNNKLLLAEVQLINKLLAFAIVSGHGLDNSRYSYVAPRYLKEQYNNVVKRTQAIDKFAELVRKTVSRDDSVKLKDWNSA